MSSLVSEHAACRHGLLLDRCMIDRRNAPAHARQLYVMGTCSDRKSHLHSHTHARTHVHNKKLCTSHRPTDHQNHHHFVQMRSRTHFLDTDARRQKAVCCSRELEWNVAISVALRRAKGRPPPRWTPRIMVVLCYASSRCPWRSPCQLSALTRCGTPYLDTTAPHLWPLLGPLAQKRAPALHGEILPPANSAKSWSSAA